MNSHPRLKPRRMPRQQRGERRVAALLHAAADVIAESGYEAATMTEIADRAGACIGSLYQFFPSKQSLTQALRAKYGNEFQKLWAPLEDSAASLSIEQLVGRLIDETVQFRNWGVSRRLSDCRVSRYLQRARHATRRAAKSN